MPKAVSSFELTLKSRSLHQTLTNWLYGELRSAILEGRLAPGARLPASRDFASQYELSRGTVVSVLERLQAEGYVTSRDRKSTRLNSSHQIISYAVFCLKKKKTRRSPLGSPPSFPLRHHT